MTAVKICKKYIRYLYFLLFYRFSIGLRFEYIPKPCNVFFLQGFVLKDASSLCSHRWKDVFALTLTTLDSIYNFLNTDQLSCPLCRKATSKHDVSNPMLNNVLFLGCNSA